MPREKKNGSFLNAKLPKDIIDRVNNYHEKTRIPKTAIVEFALREYLDKVEKEEKKKK